MSRYIDADALVKDLKEELEIDSPVLNEVENKWVKKGIRIAIKDVKHFPTADVVEVVRCKDCKYYKPQTRSIAWNNTTKYCCRGANVKVNEDDYCSYGERRTE